jgi:tripartite-type tricarboxylate transporter receptor subunit TctC
MTAAASLLAAAGLLTGASACSSEQSTGDSALPCNTVNLVVPYAPGGSSDTVGRALADAASAESGIRFDVVNQEGANGTVAATEVATQSPDPCTLIYLPNGPFASMPYFQDIQFEPADFRGIAAVNEEPIILVVNADSEWNSLEDIAAMEEHRFTYASSGTGSYTQLALAQTFATLDLDAEGIPFDGSAPALTAVLGGQVEMAAVHPGEAMQYLESGDMRALAVYSEEQIESLPEVPTATDQGADVERSVWKAVYANDEIPDEAAAELEQILAAAVESEEVTTVLENLYSERSSVETGELIDELQAEKDENATTFADLGLLDE